MARFWGTKWLGFLLFIHPLSDHYWAKSQSQSNLPSKDPQGKGVVDIFTKKRHLPAHSFHLLWACVRPSCLVMMIIMVHLGCEWRSQTWEMVSQWEIIAKIPPTWLKWLWKCGCKLCSKLFNITSYVTLSKYLYFWMENWNSQKSSWLL